MSVTSAEPAAQVGRRSDNPAARDRSRAVAIWLWTVAALVIGMVVVGGATRLTGSGLSITEWKPLRGVLPPLTPLDWAAEFRSYQRIPQYRLVNADMTLAQFRPLFWWEWSHRLLGRLIGMVFFVPLFAFVATGRIPRRLVGPCMLIFVLGGLQGAIGWWMVASGVFSQAMTAVAPERLAIHLGLALLLYLACLWTGLEAWFGRGAPAAGAARRWAGWARGLVALALVQSLLGALVAGNHAGLIYNDWPLMNGRLLPSDYARQTVWATLLHSQAAVQFNHRLGAYGLFAGAISFAVVASRSSEPPQPVRRLAVALAAIVCLQLMLGIATLVWVAPLQLSLAHQLGAVAVLTVAVMLAWRAGRSGARYGVTGAAQG